MNKHSETIVGHQAAFMLLCVIVGGLLFTGIGMFLNSFNV